MNTCTFAEAEADARVDGDTTPQLSPSGTNETSDSRLRTPDDQARRQRQSNGRSHSLDHSRSLPLGSSDLKKAPTRRSLGWIPELSVPSGCSEPVAADCTLPPIIGCSTNRNSRHETTSQTSPLLSFAHLASQTDRQGDYTNQVDRHTSRRDPARTEGARSEGIEDELRRSTKVIPEAREPDIEGDHVQSADGYSRHVKAQHDHEAATKHRPLAHIPRYISRVTTHPYRTVRRHSEPKTTPQPIDSIGREMVKLLLRDHSVSVSFKPLDVDVLDPRAREL